MHLAFQEGYLAGYRTLCRHLEKPIYFGLYQSPSNRNGLNLHLKTPRIPQPSLPDAKKKTIDQKAKTPKETAKQTQGGVRLTPYSPERTPSAMCNKTPRRQPLCVADWTTGEMRGLSLAGAKTGWLRDGMIVS